MSGEMVQILVILATIAVHFNGLGSGLHMEVLPKVINELTDTLIVKCAPNDKSVLVIELGKTGQLPLAVLRQNHLTHGADMKDNMKAEGLIDEVNITNSFLQISIKKPRASDGGQYECKLFNIDAEGSLKEGKAYANVTVDNISEKVVHTHLFQRLADLETQFGDQHKEIDSLKTQLGDQQKETNSLKTEHRDLQKEIDSLENQLGDQRNETDSLKKQLRDQQKEIDSLETQLGDQQHETDSLNKQLGGQQKEIDSLKTEHRDQQKGIDSLENQLGDQRNETDSLKKQLRDQQKEIDSLKTEHRDQQKGIDSLETQLGDQQKEIDSVKKQLWDQQNETDRWKTEHRDQQKEIDSLEKQLGDQQNETDSLNKQLGDQQNETDSLNKQLGDKQKEIDSLKQQRVTHEAQYKLLDNKVTQHLTKESFRSAFLAGGGDNYEKNEIVKYPIVKLNIGGHYNPGTGVYTAPVDGLYVFHLLGTNYIKDLYVEIDMRVNGVTASRMRAYDKDDWEQSSMSVITNLKTGDKVDCYVDDESGGSVGMDGFPYTAFSGYLIKTM